MGNKTLVYKQKVHNNLSESYKHLLRLQNAIVVLEENYVFPYYEDNNEIAVNILNAIYKLKMDLQQILDSIQKMVG